MTVLGVDTGMTVKIKMIDANNRSYVKSYGSITDIAIDSSGDGASENLVGIGMLDTDGTTTVLAFPDTVIAEFAVVRDARYATPATYDEGATAKKIYDNTLTRLKHACVAIAATDKWGMFDFPAYCKHLLRTMKDVRR
jgi:hypothetical protein